MFIYHILQIVISLIFIVCGFHILVLNYSVLIIKRHSSFIPFIGGIFCFLGIKIFPNSIVTSYYLSLIIIYAKKLAWICFFIDYTFFSLTLFILSFLYSKFNKISLIQSYKKNFPTFVMNPDLREYSSEESEEEEEDVYLSVGRSPVEKEESNIPTDQN